MIYINNEEVYTRTQAYNFLKELLGVPKKVLISKSFFCLFFKESDGHYYVKTSEDIIKDIFVKESLAELNKVYYEKIIGENPDEAKEISKKVMHVVGKLLVA